jgi:hypothetical protein
LAMALNLACQAAPQPVNPASVTYNSDREFAAVLRIGARASPGRELAPRTLNSRPKQNYLANLHAFPCLWPDSDMSTQPLARDCGRKLGLPVWQATAI